MKNPARDSFRESVFARDNHKCVICGKPAKDAHHILERRLFLDGGYNPDNGASLCEKHHIEAETTQLSCEEIRKAAGITKIVLPEDYYDDQRYTKWGDVILESGKRMPGPLYLDDSVQKILDQADMHGLYVKYVKYPRSYHLPFSEGITNDDRCIKDCSQFEGKEVVVTEKMDGENTSFYNDYIHARAIDGRNHWSRSWVKNLHSKIAYEIPDRWRLCGENMYAKHSIKYEGLEDYFYLFSIWDHRNVCLSWEETEAYAEVLGLTMVPVLYKGKWDEELIRNLYKEEKRDTMEGYVVRLAGEFPYIDFKRSLAKFVRKNHINPEDHHWFFTASEKNERRT